MFTVLLNPPKPISHVLRATSQTLVKILLQCLKVENQELTIKLPLQAFSSLRVLPKKMFLNFHFVSYAEVTYLNGFDCTFAHRTQVSVYYFRSFQYNINLGCEILQNQSGSCKNRSRYSLLTANKTLQIALKNF